MSANESRPTLGVVAAPEASRPTTSVLPATDQGREPIALRESLIDTGARVVWLDGWDSGREVGRAEGYARGHAAGYDKGFDDGETATLARVDADAATAYTEHVDRLIRTLTTAPDYATLAELRGEPDRAERQRSILTINGVTP